MIDVAIVGGGIAGLAAAYELTRHSVPFVLLERAARVGGVVLSEERDGYVFDAGADSLLVQKKEGLRLCAELGIEHRLVPTQPPRVAFVQRGGVLYPLPEFSVMGIPTSPGPFLRSRFISWAGKARMGAELFVPPRRDTQDESIGAFMRRRFGTEAATYLAEPLLAGIHAGDVDRLSVRALFPRFAAAEASHGSVLRAFRMDMQKRQASDPHGAFRSFPGGMSELVRAVAAALPVRSVRLNTETTAIRREPGNAGFVLETAGGDVVRARSVVLAAPAFVVARLTVSLDPDLSRACSDIRYASTATVSLAFDRSAIRHSLEGSGVVVPKVEGLGILASSWMSSKWQNRAPVNRALLRAFVGGARDPQALERTDAELVALVIAALTPTLGISAAPLTTEVYRWERAVAQHEVGHLERLASIEDRLAQIPGLYVTGSGFRGSGIPDCIADGRATGAKSAAWLQTQLLSAETHR